MAQPGLATFGQLLRPLALRVEQIQIVSQGARVEKVHMRR
jgi:hypothetical protein